jgi:ribonuclease P protein component
MAGSRILRLKKRPEFLAVAAAARKCVTPSVVVQARPPTADTPAGAPARFGFTATRKVGGSVVRNRARRRIKAAAALLGPLHAQPGVDYVFVARNGVLTRPWAKLLQDVEQGIARALEPARPRR